MNKMLIILEGQGDTEVKFIDAEWEEWLSTPPDFPPGTLASLNLLLTAAKYPSRRARGKMTERFRSARAVFDSTA